LNGEGSTHSEEKNYQQEERKCSSLWDFARPNNKKRLAFETITFFMTGEHFLVCANILPD
jgi:hypothetical protein